MKKRNLYLIIIALYLLTAICVMSIFGTMVSLKYQVDHNYWSIDVNKNLSANQKNIEIQKLDRKAKQLNTRIYVLCFLGILTFSTATILIYQRKKIIEKLPNKA